MDINYIIDEENQLYNRDTKIEFLNDWCKGKSQKTLIEYEKTLRICAKIEKQYDEDLVFLQVEEFENLLRNFNSTTVKSLKSYLNVLKKYEIWREQQGHLNGKFLMTPTFDKVDLEKYLNRIGSVEKFISLDEIFKFLDRIDNAQDAVIFTLLYEGIKGSNNKEITNLKVSDYTKDGIVTIGGKNPRQIKVHDKTLQLMNEARDQKFYEKTRKHTAINDMTSTHYELPLESPYLIRQNVKNSSSDGGYSLYTTGSPANWQTINSRVKKIAMHERINKPYLTAQSLLQSGMLYKALEKEIEKGKDKLTIDDYKAVMVQYGGKPENYFILKEMYETVFEPIRNKEYEKIEIAELEKKS